VALGCGLLQLGGARPGRADTLPRQQAPAPAPKISADDDQFLEEFGRASFQFFWEGAHPQTGLVKDRGLAAGHDAFDIASIAATGFALTGLCIAHRRGWGNPDEILARARATLKFLAARLENQRGFFFHYVDMETGQRVFQCEVSSVDTSLLLCGALACRAYFQDADVAKFATQVYERVDWPWMLNDDHTLSMGWLPETGFLTARWDVYSELMMTYLLGLGSRTHPLPADSWDAWKRPIMDFEGERYVGSLAPLFVHQYSHAWYDFRGKRDKYANYFENSVAATRAHKRWCVGLAKQFPDYSENLWGVTASDSAHGYVVWGGPPTMGPIDGSVVPCAAAGSLAFLPDDSLRVLRTIRDQHGKNAWARYGFVDAFNPLTNWYDPDVIGIDVGIGLLMAENCRTGFVWNTFMKNEEAQRAFERAGFHAE